MVDLYGPCWIKVAFGLDTVDGKIRIPYCKLNKIKINVTQLFLNSPFTLSGTSLKDALSSIYKLDYFCVIKIRKILYYQKNKDYSWYKFVNDCWQIDLFYWYLV